MLAVVGAVFKVIQHVEGYTFESNKKTIEVPEHYKIKVDEVYPNGTINQQTIVAYAENENLINKLKVLNPYQQVKFLVDIIFYQGQTNKVVVLDVIDSETEQEVISNIFNSYTK